MYELATQELMVFVVLGFCTGIFFTFYLARFFEIVHLWKVANRTVGCLLLMCVHILEDVEFIREIKRKAMKDAEFTPKQIREFDEVYDRFLTNWKDSVIMNIKNNAPQNFRSLFPFTNWKEALQFLEGLQDA
tara:strand:- start:2 stop:397 length:396 start_codon:yes stop_codon:yes gene_type:complete